MGCFADQIEEALETSDWRFWIKYVGHGGAENLSAHPLTLCFFVPADGILPSVLARGTPEFALTPLGTDGRFAAGHRFRVAVAALFADFCTADPWVERVIGPADVCIYRHSIFYLLKSPFS